MVGAAIGLGAAKRRKASLGPLTDAIITAIRAKGWAANASAPPASFDPVGNPRTVALSRAGFNGSGGTTTYTEALLLTSRIRQAYPSQGSLDASRIALSDYVYSTDSIIGSAANNSTEISPKPICRWASPDRGLVGNTLAREALAIVVAHRNARNGEEVACAVWTISDGTTMSDLRHR